MPVHASRRPAAALAALLAGDADVIAQPSS